jgi:hypothetical protein
MFRQLTYPPLNNQQDGRFDAQMLIVLKRVNLFEDTAKAMKLERGLRPLRLLD